MKCFAALSLLVCPLSMISAAQTDAETPIVTALPPYPLDEVLLSFREGCGQMQVFENPIAGETVQIVLTEVNIGGQRVSGCRLFDAGEARQITIKQVTSGPDSEPLTQIGQDGLIVADWEPGHDSFQLYFIPSGNPLEEITKFNGIGLKADTVGDTE